MKFQMKQITSRTVQVSGKVECSLYTQGDPRLNIGQSQSFFQKFVTISLSVNNLYVHSIFPVILLCLRIQVGINREGRIEYRLGISHTCTAMSVQAIFYRDIADLFQMAIVCSTVLEGV